MSAYRVALWQEWHWWIAQCLDLELATQGGSESEAIENIQEALLLHFQPPSAPAGAAPQAPPGARIIEVQVGD